MSTVTSTGHRVVMMPCLEITNPDAVADGAEPEYQHAVKRWPDPLKPYIRLQADAVAQLAAEVGGLPELGPDEFASRPAMACRACGTTSERTDIFRWRDRKDAVLWCDYTVIDLACHGFLLPVGQKV